MRQVWIGWDTLAEERLTPSNEVVGGLAIYKPAQILFVKRVIPPLAGVSARRFNVKGQVLVKLLLAVVGSV